MIGLIFISPSTTTGRSTMLCMPRTPDWGKFRIGVDNIEPYTPPLLMVNVPPCRSSIVSFPSLAFSEISLIFFSISANESSSAFLKTGTTKPLSVPTAKLIL